MSPRVILPLTFFRQYRVFQLDFKNSFMNGTLNEVLYVEAPDVLRLDHRSRDCFRLHKALYGLKQAGWALNMRLDNCIISMGFQKSVPGSEALPSHFSLRWRFRPCICQLLSIGWYRRSECANRCRRNCQEIRSTIGSNSIKIPWNGLLEREERSFIHNLMAVMRILK